MLGELGDAAPRANRAGLTAAQAGAAYALPPAVGESVLFHKVFFERAFGGWHEELAG